MIEEITADADERMGKTLESMHSAFARIRSGRAHPGLLDGVRVGRMSFVSDSVIGENAVVGSGTMTLIQNTYQSPVAVRMPEGTVDSGLDKVGAFLGDGARVGASNTLAPGAVVPPGEVIPHHCTWPAEGD